MPPKKTRAMNSKGKKPVKVPVAEFQDPSPQAAAGELRAAKKWVKALSPNVFAIDVGKMTKMQTTVSFEFPPDDPEPHKFTISMKIPHTVQTEDEDDVSKALVTKAKEFCRVKRTVTDILGLFVQVAVEQNKALEEIMASPAGGAEAASSSPPESSTKKENPKKREWWEDDDKDNENGEEGAAEPEKEKGVNWDEIGDEVKWGDEQDEDGADAAMFDGEEEDESGWGNTVRVDLLQRSSSSLSDKRAPTRTSSNPSTPRTDTSSGSGASRPQGYRVLNKSEVRNLMQSVVDKVATSLSVTPGAACVLLRNNQWNEKATIQAYTADSKELCKKAGVTTTLTNVISLPDPNSADSFDCPVCFDSAALPNTFSMPCGHRLCVDCYKQHLTSSITGGSADGGSCLDTRCPGEKCKELVLAEVFEILLDSSLYLKYEQALLRSFVDDNKHLTWCPGTDCENVIVVGEDRSRVPSTVKCSCDTTFCFFCRGEAHAPCTCKEYSDWCGRDKGSQSLDMKFLLEQTKPCPKCGVRTNKDGGCMYIVCSQCHTPWCWQCGKGDHHVWECNRPEWGKNSGKEDSNRYLFFYERFFNHEQSEKISKKQLEEIATRMRTLVETGATWQRVEFLRRACELVIQARHVIKWTYAKDFYVSEKKVSELFRHRQRDLEEYTEHLNKITDECSQAKLSEGSMKALEEKRITALTWISTLSSFLDGFVTATFSEAASATPAPSESSS